MDITLQNLLAKRAGAGDIEVRFWVLVNELGPGSQTVLEGLHQIKLQRTNLGYKLEGELAQKAAAQRVA